VVVFERFDVEKVEAGLFQFVEQVVKP